MWYNKHTKTSVSPDDSIKDVVPERWHSMSCTWNIILFLMCGVKPREWRSTPRGYGRSLWWYRLEILCWLAHHQLYRHQTWDITTGMEGISWVCFSIPSATLMTEWYSMCRTPFIRNYILDAVIRWHGCFRVLIIPHHCQLEKFWPPRALAYPQLRIEEVNSTSPALHWEMSSQGLHALTGCNTTSKVSTKLAAIRNIRKPGNSSLTYLDRSQLTESEIKMAETLIFWSSVWDHQQTWIPSTYLEMPSRWTLRLYFYQCKETYPKSLLATAVVGPGIISRCLLEYKCCVLRFCEK